MEVSGATVTAISPDRPGGVGLDLTDATVVAGLIDAHTHFRRDGDSLAHLAARGLATLAAGFTTIRDVGSAGDLLFRYREHLQASCQPGPDLRLSGHILSAPSPGADMFGDMYRVARTPEDFRAGVREEAGRGADLIKVMVTGALTVPEEDVDPPQLTPGELAAVVEESHRLGLPVAAHAEGLDGIELAVEVGVDTIEHGEKAHLSPGLLDRMADEGIILVPTLAVFGAVERSDTDPATKERARRLGEHARSTVSAAQKAGVPIAVGPDGVHPLIPAGEQSTELRLLSDAGLGPQELIESATSVGARACRLPPDRTGLNVGKHADLVAFRGDPFADPSVLWRRPALVVKSGRVVAADSADTYARAASATSTEGS